jgi:hypothetical protein
LKKTTNSDERLTRNGSTCKSKKYHSESKDLLIG